jgi:hypothetical protein
MCSHSHAHIHTHTHTATFEKIEEPARWRSLGQDHHACLGLFCLRGKEGEADALYLVRRRDTVHPCVCCAHPLLRAAAVCFGTMFLFLFSLCVCSWNGLSIPCHALMPCCINSLEHTNALMSCCINSLEHTNALMSCCINSMRS